MTTSTLPTASIWRMSVASFLPPNKRAKAVNGWISWLPMAVILFIQAAGTLRLKNSVFRDEGLYIWEGHRIFQHWFHGAVLFDNPSQYFSGSPWIYAPLAAMLDRVGIWTHLGGLNVVRGFSLLCMMATTVFIYAFTKRLFTRRAGLIAALAFVLAGPTQHLGHFATFDAPAVGLLAGACALGVRAVQRRKMIYAPVVGTLLALAAVTKYAALLFVPVVLGVIFLTAARRAFAPTLALLSFCTFGAVLALWVTTLGRADYKGFTSTTTHRVSLTDASVSDIVRDAVSYAGVFYAVALLGLLVALVRLRRHWIPLVLLVGMLAPVAYQAHIHESVSLDKHVDFGLIFGAPLVGVALAASKHVIAKVAASLVMLGMFISGAAVSHHLFGEWSNTTALTDTMAYAFQDAPYIRTLGEPYEGIRQTFEDSSQYWQWDTTDPIVALYYQPKNGPALRGIEAAKAGLRDDYWQLVYFNGSTGASQELEPLLPSLGYKLTDTVVLQNNRGKDTYRIWQRFH